MAYGTHYVAQAAAVPAVPTGTSTTNGETSTIEAGLTEEQQALVNTNHQYFISRDLDKDDA